MLWKALVAKISPGDLGKSAATMYLTPDGNAGTLTAAVLPELCSRHNSPVRPHAITTLVGPAASDAATEPGGAAIVLVLDEPKHAAPAACAVARAFPLFLMKKVAHESGVKRGSVRVGFALRVGLVTWGSDEQLYYTSAAIAADGVR